MFTTVSISLAVNFVLARNASTETTALQPPQFSKIMAIRLLIPIFVAALLNACASPAGMRYQNTDAVGLPPQVLGMLNSAGIPLDSMAAVAIRLSDGVTLLSHRPDASMQPASTMKLVTTMVGLERLGPTYRWRTELLSAAPVENGVLRGDLTLCGGGDGDLTWEAFRRMLQTLRHKGIREIHGDLVLDRTLFQPTRTDVGVPPFDNEPDAEYNVIPDALLVNTNLLKIDLESDHQSVRARMTPALDGVTIDMQMKLIDRTCDKWDDGWQTPVVEKTFTGSIHIQFRGEFPRNCTASSGINVLERDQFIDRLFRTLWAAEGGTFRGVVREGPATSTDAKLLAQHRSRTLADMLRVINKPSDNALTRLLFLTLGTRESAGDSTTLARAEQQVAAWFRQIGVATDGYVAENGSGLSRKERLRPSQLAALLVAEYHSNWAPEFLSSLPVVGLDGTMRRRLRDSPVASRARMKTGTLNNVVALAGYVPDSMGQMHVVVAIINHKPGSANLAGVGQPILDALVDWMGRGGSK